MSLPSISIPKKSKRPHPVAVRTPYHEAFVADLKVSVPAYGRSWDPEAKVWRVAREHRHAAQDAMLRHWAEIDVHDAGEDYVLTRNGEMIEQPTLFT